MKTTIDGLRRKLEILYARYDIYLLPALKFLLALSVYLGINRFLGYMRPLDNIFVVLVLALISAVLPLNGVVLLSFLLCTAHCFGLGLEVGAFAAVLFLLMALLYFRFVPGDALALVLTPAAFFLRMPCAVPLAMGLIRGPVSAVSAILGTAAWKFLDIVRTNAAVAYEEDANGLAVLSRMGSGLFRDGQTWILMLAAAAAVLTVVFVRKLGAAYGEIIAVAAGCGVYLILVLGGGAFVGMPMPVPVLIAGTAGAGVIVWLMSVFVYSPDYEGSTRLQFEDDEFYYYVKAVPKRDTVRKRTSPGSRRRDPGHTLRSAGPLGADIPEEEPADWEADYTEGLERTLKDL